MSNTKPKSKKTSNKPSLNVKKNLVNTKSLPFSGPGRKKSEKVTENISLLEGLKCFGFSSLSSLITYFIILDPGFFDGIKSFNPHGQRITLEDAVVRAWFTFILKLFPYSFQGIENPVLGFPRGLPHPGLDEGTEVQRG